MQHTFSGHDVPSANATLETDQNKNYQAMTDDRVTGQRMSSVISPASDRRDSFNSSIYTSFSPQGSTMPWTNEVLSMTTCTAESGPVDHHLNIPAHEAKSSLESAQSFLSHDSQTHWQSPGYSSMVDAKSQEPILLSTYDFDPANNQTYATSYDAISPLLSIDMPPQGNMYGDSTTLTEPDLRPLVLSPTRGVNGDWMTLAEQDQHVARLNKRIRQQTPPRSFTPSFARRDGVRKKNARFDIPEGRNLENIDELIALANEDGDANHVRELKQQKRLLRNRQAALDSRQRKKKHTEELEKEQKIWLENRSESQMRIDTLELQMEQLRFQNQQLRLANGTLRNDLAHLASQHRPMPTDSSDSMLFSAYGSISDDAEQSHITVPEKSFSSRADTNDLDHIIVDESKPLIAFPLKEASSARPFTNAESSISATTGSSVDSPAVRFAPSSVGSTNSTQSCNLLTLLLYGSLAVTRSSLRKDNAAAGVNNDLRIEATNVLNQLLKHGRINRSQYAASPNGDMTGMPSPTTRALNAHNRSTPMSANDAARTQDKAGPTNNMFHGARQNVGDTSAGIVAPSSSTALRSATSPLTDSTFVTENDRSAQPTETTQCTTVYLASQADEEHVSSPLLHGLLSQNLPIDMLQDLRHKFDYGDEANHYNSHQ